MRRLLRMLLLTIAVLSIPVLAFVIVIITLAPGSVVPLLGIILAALANTVAYWWYRRRLASHGVARYLWGLSLAVVIVGLLVPPLLFSTGSRARAARARADTRTVASALVQYLAHCGDLPNQVGDTCKPGGAAPGSLLVVQTNSSGQTGGPFLERFPTPPAGWGASYAINIPGPGGAGTFQVVAGPPTNGDNAGAQVTAP